MSVQHKIRGRVLRYGDEVDTDVIIPSRYQPQVLTGPEAELAARQYTLADLDSDFTKKVQKGDILVAGRNFGCGSSREIAANVFKYVGIAGIIAKSFANIFYRNAINNGLPVIVTPDSAIDAINEGDEIEIDITTGDISNISTGRSFKAEPIPAYLMQILEAGGIIAYTKQKYRL